MGALNVTEEFETLQNPPTVPVPVFVNIIVTPAPPVQVEQVTAAFVSSVKSPFVIQYVPGFISTVWFLMSHPPVICVFAPMVILPFSKDEEPDTTQLPDVLVAQGGEVGMPVVSKVWVSVDEYGSG